MDPTAWVFLPVNIILDVLRENPLGFLVVVSVICFVLYVLGRQAGRDSDA